MIACVEQFRRKVAAGKLVRFYTNPDELKSQVMQALVHAFNFRPQEGWVRARNMRRLEDLDQINNLQQQVRKLEMENATLRQRDRTDLLAQGNDEFTHTFLMLAHNESPPAEEIVLSGTWDELFVALFPDGLRIDNSLRINGRLVGFLRRRVKRKYPEAEAWIDSAQANHFGDREYHAFKRLVRIQLQGLGLIDIDPSARGGEGWELTDKGKLLCAALSGHRRYDEEVDPESPK